MLITIPNYVKSKGGWIEYHIYVDSEFQASVRFRDLEKLYRDSLKSCRIIAKSDEESAIRLRQESSKIPAFPPKKVFNLSAKQLENRRLLLQNWIISLTQLPQSHPALQQLKSFLSIQNRATFSSQSEEQKELQIYLLDETFVTISVKNDSDVIAETCQMLNLPRSLHDKFSLYIFLASNSEWKIYRKLYSFESAYVSLKRIIGSVEELSNQLRLVLIRNYWNPLVDEELLNSKNGINLLYSETVKCFRREWLLPNDHESDEMLQKRLYNSETNPTDENKKAFINLARSQKYFSCFQFGPCFCDYPVSKTACLLNIGDFKLFIRILENDSIREMMIPLRWVKSWRITKSDHIAKSISILIGVSRSSEMWITILSRDSIVISSLLYSMIQKIGPVDHSQDGTTIQYKTDSKETQNGSTIENELTNNNMPSLEEV